MAVAMARVAVGGSAGGGWGAGGGGGAARVRCAVGAGMGGGWARLAAPIVAGRGGAWAAGAGDGVWRGELAVCKLPFAAAALPPTSCLDNP